MKDPLKGLSGLIWQENPSSLTKSDSVWAAFLNTLHDLQCEIIKEVSPESACTSSFFSLEINLLVAGLDSLLAFTAVEVVLALDLVTMIKINDFFFTLL